MTGGFLRGSRNLNREIRNCSTIVYQTYFLNIWEDSDHGIW